MAFTATEVIQIRRWLGLQYAVYYTDSLRPALTRITDAGPEAEAGIRDLLAQLAVNWTNISNLQIQMQAGRVDDLTIDAPRGMAALRSHGRSIIKQLACALEFERIPSDVFSSPKYDPRSPLFSGHRL